MIMHRPISAEDLRALISVTVGHLMVEHKENQETLARAFETTGHYMSRKIGDGRWTLEDLDLLAERYGYDPADLLQGYVHLKTEAGERDTTPMRERIGTVVRQLMVLHNEDPENLSAIFNMTGRGFRAKVEKDRWTLDNLAVLAARYGVQPHDIAAGYDHLSNVGTEIQPDTDD